MIQALVLAFADLSEPGIRRVLGKSLLLALGVLALTAFLAWLLVVWLTDLQIGWLDSIIEFAAGLGVIVLAWLLFPVAVSSTVGIFLDEVSEAVEARHYPALPPAHGQPLMAEIKSALAFAGVALALNLLLLPLYLLLFFFPPLYALIFYGVNGYLLGREYFEQVALRRLDPAAARALRRAHQGRVLLAGVVIAFLLTVPLVNLIAPVVATAFMLHLVTGLSRPASRTQGRPGTC
jgi:CysZ protein